MPTLIIRAEQMRAFEEDLLRRWICEYLESNYPSETKPPGRAALSEFVCASIKRARAHGYAEPAAIRRFVHAAFLLGDVERDPEIARILSEPERGDGADRLAALEKTALRRLITTAATGKD